MMDRKGGCLLVPRYGPGAGGQAAPGMSWQMGRIMLKYRPIAPKPAAMAPVSTPAPQVAVAAAVGAGRGKRKASGGTGGRRGRRPKKAAAAVAPVASVGAPPVTQTTAPGEKESEKEKSLSSRSSSSSATTSVDSAPPSPPTGSKPATTLPLMPVSAPAEQQDKAPEETAPVQPVPAPRPAAPVASCWVTVEEVTSTWRDGEAPPAAAAASACSAEGAETPAFVSDQWGRVTWSNAAFTRAVDDAVALAGALPAWGTCAGFTCRVRVRHSGSARRGGSVVAPCDVWRLDASGCYLWRLDLQAALTLGGLP